MPISKADAFTLRQTGIDYEIVPRESVNKIQNCEAMAVWLYLITRPANWTVRRTDLMKRFGWGRQRYTKAMNELKGLGLINVVQVRGTDGTMQGKVIWVHHHSNESTEGLLNRPSVQPTYGSTDLRSNRPLKETDINNKETDIKTIAFDEFYSSYPKKVDKANCRRKWKRLSVEQQEKAIAGIEGFTDGKETKFISSPTAYLNGERWDDDNGSAHSQVGGWE